MEAASDHFYAKGSNRGKGVDQYSDNLAGVLTRPGDMKKTYNNNKLGLEDCFIQHFLWRGMGESREHVLP